MRIACLYIFILLCVFLYGCSSFEAEGNLDAKTKETFSSPKGKPTGAFFGDLPIIPIALDERGFNSVVDWYDNTTVLYVIDDGVGSKIYKYHLYTGVTEFFYETTGLIITLKSSQNRHYFAVHASDSSYEAKIIILDRNGKEMMDSKLDSVEVQYEWNPYEEAEIFVTSFQEDWSFQNHVMNVNRKIIELSEVNQPFIQWIGSSNVAYLKWVDNESINAPLYLFDNRDLKEVKVLDNVLAYHTYKGILVTISGYETESLYQFFNTEPIQLKRSFKLPLINTFSDKWWVPNFDYNSESDRFIYFHPKIEDDESVTLQLVVYSAISGLEEVILADTKNRPVNLSPDGSLCLVGYQSEEIIDIKKKEIIKLIKQL